MSIVLLLDELKARRVELRVDGGKLRFKAPEGVMTPELRNRIGAQKDALIANLSGHAPVEPELLRTTPSPAQKRLWFFDQLQGPSAAYNIPLYLRIRGKLDRSALRAAIYDLVRRHQSLRSSFTYEDGILHLDIIREAQVPWQDIDLTERYTKEGPSCLRGYGIELTEACFDLSKAPLLRLTLLKTGAEEYFLFIVFHHIVTDGWSFGIITQEIVAGYTARLSGMASTLPPLAWQFTDYIAWQQQQQESGAMQSNLEFWRKRLADAPTCTTIPPDFRRPPVQDFAGAAVELKIDAPTRARLLARAREWGASLSHLTLSALAILVAGRSGTRDLLIGMPLANRTRRELEPLVGMFVSIVLLRILVPPNVRSGDFVAQVKRVSTEAMEHSNIPFETLAKESGMKRDLSMNPDYQVAYNFLPLMETHLSFGGLEVDSPDLFGESNFSKCDFSFYIDERDNGLVIRVEYARSLYRRSTVEHWLEAYAAVLNVMLDHPDLPLGSLPNAGQPEKALIEAWCTGPIVPLPSGSPWARFDAVAQHRAQDPAIEENGVRTSFEQLSRRAEIVSSLLAEHGIGKGSRVGLMLPRSCDFVAAMLGVLRCGAVWVPFDLLQPPERLAKMGEKAKLAAVLGRPGDPQSEHIAPIRINIDSSTWTDSRPIPEAVHLGFDDPLYMIFTSGSTGQPKAVSVPWRGLCNIVQCFIRTFGLAPNERVSQIASPSFDASLYEMWPSLLGGCTLVIVPEELRIDPSELRDWILSREISVHFSPTPLAEALLDLDWPSKAPLRLLTTGGQSLHKHPRPGLPFKVVNNYGPTEISICATWGPVGEAQDDALAPTIGRVLENTRIAILDEWGRRCPIGTVGELFIAGTGVALGYFDEVETTARSFTSLTGEAPGLWYRTGDQVRLLPGGELDFIGRSDSQIKLRGYRIEIGEIESVLVTIQGVRHVAVRVEGDQLIAYIETDGQSIGADQIRKQITMALPAYMVPAHFVILDKLPKQSSGKIDIKAIPPFRHESTPETDGPYAEQVANELEAAIGKAWSKVLSHPAPALHANFFELGGHSLLASQVVTELRGALGVTVPVRWLFESPTIAELAERISPLLAKGEAAETVIPENRIKPDTKLITPELLPLISLTQADIDRIVSTVEGGSGNVQDIYPLVPLQEGILFHHQLQSNGDAYLNDSLIAFESIARCEAFLDAMQAIIKRHDILRTAIVWDGLSKPVQVVWRDAPLPVEVLHFDCANGPIDRQFSELCQRTPSRMDLTRAPLLRITRAEEGERVLLRLLFHHLILDHTTMEVMLEEIVAHVRGESASLPEPVPFRNFVAEAINGVKPEEHEAFFRETLGKIDAPTAPFGLLDIQRDGSKIVMGQQALSLELARRLRAQTQLHGVTPAALFHLAWALVLARCCNQDEVVFGTVLFGRMQGTTGVERAIGLFINTLPIRLTCGAVPVPEALQETQQRLLELMRHEHASLSQAQRCSAVRGQTPLFSTLLNYRHSLDQAHSSKVLGNLDIFIAEERSNYPLSLSVDDFGDGFALTALVDTSVDPERIFAFLQRSLEALLAALEMKSQIPLCELDILPPMEKQKVLVEWNGAELAKQRSEKANPQCMGDQTSDKHTFETVCVHELFEARVADHPEATALVFEDETLSYAELNSRANRLAHRLISLGVVPDSRVAIALERSPEMIVALLATLKAGGAYVSLDLSYPTERLAFMLEDSGAKVLITREALRHELPRFAHHILCLDTEASALAKQPDSNPQSQVTPQRLAYVIYTSGSTGKPKGVAIEHRSIADHSQVIGTYYQLSASDRFYQSFSFSFDASVEDTLSTLCSGAGLVLARQGLQTPEALDADIERYGVTVLHLPPVFFQQWIALERSSTPKHALRLINVGGDVFPKSAVELWRNCPLNASGSIRLLNGYGPTEATVHTALYEVPSQVAQTTVPIGRPLPNRSVYVLDRHRQPTPIGVPGELHIGGIGLARAYLNRPELTAEQFIPDPFSSTPGARLYKTGDLVRFLPDGNIEFLGRIDHQVKIRGYRIELGEIEAALLKHPSVRETVVIARKDGTGEQRLLAYLVAAIPELPGVADLRDFLKASLPEYMIPSAFVWLPELPLSSNGKVDRKALPEPEASSPSDADSAPRDAVEEILVGIWSMVLHQPKLGIHDNFFELGGHSLLATQIASRLREALSTDVPVRWIFEAPTVAQLAERIRVAQAGGQNDEASIPIPPNLIVPGTTRITPDLLPLISLSQTEIDRIASTVQGGASNVQDIYPLAPLQEGILFHHQLQSKGDTYLNDSLIAFDSLARCEAFIGAMNAIIERHDILRTAVVWSGLPKPVQVVWRKVALHIETLSFDSSKGPISEQLVECCHPKNTRIDLTHAPLLRIVRADDGGRVLLRLLFHHLIMDHTTLEVLFEEVVAYLHGQTDRFVRPVPFRNFVTQALRGISQEAHEAFFREMLGKVDTPTTPFGLLDVQGDGSKIVRAEHVLSLDLALRLRAQTQRMGATPAALCHLAWALVLARCCGQDEVVFGTVLFGRLQGGAGVERALGMFINTLPIRITCDGRPVTEAVRETQQHLLALMRHEHAPLSLAQRCSAVPASVPLFSSLLNYRHSLERNDSHSPLEGVEDLQAEERSNFPLALSIDDLSKGFSMTVQVDSSIDPERIYAFMQSSLEALIAALEMKSQIPLCELDVLPPAEKQKVLVEWNGAAWQGGNRSEEREARSTSSGQAGSENAPEGMSPPAGGKQETDPQSLVCKQAPALKTIETCVHQLFEKQVSNSPEATALVFEDQALSYAELNSRANRLAHRLISLGVVPDSRVAIALERSPEMIVALLATLKAGGAYVSLDLSYPTERLAFMLEDSGAKVLIVREALRHELPSFAHHILCLDTEAPALAKQPDSNPQSQVTPQRLAYVIYTSGSTGKPKGVAIEHRSIADHCQVIGTYYQLSASDRFYQSFSFSFDASVEDTLSTLCSGAGLVLARQGLQTPEALDADIERYGVTVLHLPPVFFQQWIALERSSTPKHALRLINVGGDVFPKSAVELWRNCPLNGKGSIRLLNGYGPTEVTVHTALYEVPSQVAQATVPIGRPLPNRSVYVLDRHKQLTPSGVPGELHIGGIGLARAYLNRPELTAEQFIPDPFSSTPGARLYKTGDLVRFLPDGNIEFLGRIDHQVKIRGYRIELGEIEAALLKHPSVRETVVIARKDGTGEQRLLAYLVAAIPELPGVADLRDFLKASLPEYMIPSAFVWLPELPLSSNGKVDRKALPEPEASSPSDADSAPRDAVEEILVGIWSTVLHQPKLGIHDNFFELGGHSLLATQIASRLREALSTDVPVRWIFEAPTVAQLAERIRVAQAGGQNDEASIPIPPNLIVPGTTRITPDLLPLISLSQAEIDRIVSTVDGGGRNVQDIYPLAPLQEGLFFHHLLQNKEDTYQIQSTTSFDSFDRSEKFIEALNKIVARHDILRSSIVWDQLLEPVQVVWREVHIPVETLNLDPAQGPSAEQLSKYCKLHYSRIDLTKAPLLRIVRARDDERCLLALIVHHLILDHTTLNILSSEVAAQLLGQTEALATTIPYRNFVGQTRKGLSVKAHEAFFRDMLATVKVPTAPFGLLELSNGFSTGATARISLPSDLALSLRTQSQRMGVTPAGLCHLAWALILSRLCDQDKVVFGTVLFGRMQGGAGVERALGLFINTLPIQIDCTDRSVSDALRHTQQCLLALMRHEHAPLSLAQRCSGISAPAPLFSTLLNFRHSPEMKNEVEAFEGMEQFEATEHSNYPINLSVDDLENGFAISVNSDAAIEPDRLCRLMQQVIATLLQVLRDAPQTPLSSLNLLTSEDKQQLCSTRNTGAKAPSPVPKRKSGRI